MLTLCARVKRTSLLLSRLKTMNVNDSKWFFNNSRSDFKSNTRKVFLSDLFIYFPPSLRFFSVGNVNIYRLEEYVRGRGERRLIDFKLYLIVQLHENFPSGLDLLIALSLSFAWQLFKSKKRAAVDWEKYFFLFIWLWFDLPSSEWVLCNLLFAVFLGKIHFMANYLNAWFSRQPPPLLPFSPTRRTQPWVFWTFYWWSSTYVTHYYVFFFSLEGWSKSPNKTRLNFYGEFAASQPSIQSMLIAEMNKLISFFCSESKVNPEEHVGLKGRNWLGSWYHYQTFKKSIRCLRQKSHKIQ